MAKGVLGNDPFLRGAPAREDSATPGQPAKPVAPPPPAGRRSAVGKPPPLARPPEPEPVVAKPAAPAKQEPSKPAPKVPKAPAEPKQWPTAARKNKPARSSVRVLMSARKPILDTPPERLKEWEPTSHPGAPELLARIQEHLKEFFPHPNTPELQAVLGDVATPHAHSPDAMVLTGATAHRHSPDAVVVTPATAHRDSPVAVEVKGATPHRDSPAAVEVTGATPRRDSPVAVDVKGATPRRDSPGAVDVKGTTPRRDSPGAVDVKGTTPRRDSPVAVDVKGATPHRNSPVAVELTGATPHRDSPVAVELTGATAHRDSPVAVELTGATAHRHSPEVVADLSDGGAVAHPLSPEVLEVRPISERAPLVVEVIEGQDSGTPMSDREISPDARASSPVVALGVAREIFSGGIARPLAGAARGIFQAARAAIGLGGGTELDMWGKDVSLTKNLEPLSDFLYQRYFRVTVEGADHVPKDASLLIANHSGALPLDGPMLYLALQRERADLSEVRWLVEDQVFHAPFIGVLANRLGAVRANPENATRLLEEKRPVAVFPEGIHGLSKPFSERYQLKRFGRGGYVKLAVRLNVPIIPVAIVGAEESMPLLARLPGGPFGLPYLPITPPPLPAKWQIRFGEPIDLSEAPDNAEEDLAWVAQINDRTRTTIEGMLTAMLRARTSVF